MSRRWHSLATLAVACALSLFFGKEAAAQDITPFCVSGCIPAFAVKVTPDSSPIARAALTTGWQASFVVTNIGTEDDTYDLSCHGSGPVTCTGQSATTATLASNASTTITVNYSVGGAGIGDIKLTADGGSVDVGSFRITATGPGAPVISTEPHNGINRDVGKCVASCLDATYAHSTPSYISLGAERSFGLVYNSSTVNPMPVVQVDVDKNAQTTVLPTAYSIQLKKSDGSLLTLENGATVAYFGVPPTLPARLTAAFSSQANGLGIGAWGISVLVTAYYPAGNLVSTSSVRVLVNDQSRSQFGAGVSMAGLQQIRFLPGSYAVVVTEGSGSIAWYDRNTSTSPFTTPAGATEQLVYTGSAYRRYSLDSSYVEFNTAGRMTKSVDRHGNATTITYATVDSVPTRITDPMGKYIDLCFGDTGLCYTGKLLRARVLNATTGVRETNYLINGSGQLVRITDPDGYSDSLSYGTNGLLATVWDRARQRTDYTFDALRRVTQVQAASTKLWDGSTARPTVTTRAIESTAWQPATAGATQGAPKSAVKGDTLRVRITDPVNNTVKVAVDRFGAPTLVVDPYGATTTITRDSEGRPTDVREPDGHRVTYTYAGYVVTQMWDNTTGQTVNYTYRPNSNYLLKVSGNTVRQDFLYTASNGGNQRALSKVYLNGTGAPGTAVNAQLVQWHKPDLLGRDTALVDSLNFGMHYSYEATWGNVRTTKDPTLQAVTTTTYDDKGRAVKTVVPLSGTDTVTYGIMNQVTWSRTGLGLVTQYAYDPTTLLLTQLTDPKGQANTFAYNALGALTRQYSVATPSQADSVGYDLAGRPVRIWRRSGNAIELTYDLAGRLASRVVPGAPTDYFRYDVLTQHWQVDSNAIAKDSVYLDVPARKSSTVTRILGRMYTLTSTFNQSAQNTGYTVVDSSNAYTQTATYAYTGVGLPDSMCIGTECLYNGRSGNLGRIRVTYDSNSNPLKTWSITQVLDNKRRVAIQTFSPSSLSGFNVTWTRDSLGRVKTRTKPGGSGTRSFYYDLDGQLTQSCDIVTCPGSANWAYDAAGNRSETGVTTTYGAGNRLAVRGTEAFQYDANDNLTCRYPAAATCAWGQVGKRYTYDALGRLSKVEDLATQTILATYGYDGMDRRVVRRIIAAPAVTELHIHLGDQVVMDVDSATGTRRAEYAWLPGGADRLFAMKTPTWNGWAVAITDPNIGTIRGIARFGSGALLKQYPEAPWGDAVADTGVKVRFRLAAASFEPETGLYYMRARFYDPGLGRFLTEDPIGIAGGINLFSFAGNDPVNRSDPTGLTPGGSCVLWSPFTPGVCLYREPLDPITTVADPDEPLMCSIRCGLYHLPQLPMNYPTIGVDPYPRKHYREEVLKTDSKVCSAAKAMTYVLGPIADLAQVYSIWVLAPELSVGIRAGALGIKSLIATRGIYGVRQLSMGVGIVGLRTVQTLGLTGGAGASQSVPEPTDLRNLSVTFQSYRMMQEVCP